MSAEEIMSSKKIRTCIKCGKAAQSPMLPLCIVCDLARIKAGLTADDIKREAARIRGDEK